MRKHLERCSTLAFAALAFGLPVAAQAQAAGPAGTVDEPAPQDSRSGDIVVTGYRAATAAAIKAKEQSTVILDAISQDDIGRLPDLNIVESARRIPGLSTVSGLNPATNRDLYERVAIRGLDPKYNLITVDGVPLASSEYTVRGARLDQFPNSLVARIEAIKTITAEFDPQGLGGQLNIVSRSAFTSREKDFFVANASGGLNTTSGEFLASRKPNFRADATGSVRFGADEQFGFILSGEYQRLRSAESSELPGDTDGSGWTYYTASGSKTPFASLSSNGILVAARPQDYRFDDDRTRASVNGKLEYHLSPGNQISLFGGYYYDLDSEFRAELLASPSGAPTNVTATSGTFSSGNVQQGIVLQPQTRRTVLTTFKGDFSPMERVKLDVTASYSRATYDQERTFQKWATGAKPASSSSVSTANFGYSYTLDNGAPLVTQNAPTLASDPSQYVNLYIRDVSLKSRSEVDYAAANLAYNADRGDQGVGFRVGGSYTSTVVNFDQTYLELAAASTATQKQIGGLGNFIYDRRFSAIQELVTPYLVIDPSKVSAFVAANPSLFVATDQRANNYGDDFDDLETVGAGYAQALFQTGPLRLLAGVRYDHTDIRADTNSVPTAVGSTAYVPLTRNSSYGFWLPSALATYQFSPKMRLTAGFSKTIGRPDYSQYAARTTYSIGTTPGVLTINTGNPSLKPRQSFNYDLSYEWYFQNGGLFSAAAFYKDIRNEIFSASQQGPATTYLGVTYPDVTISQSINSAKAHVEGVELRYTQQRLAFLPRPLQGLGFDLNATWLKGSFGVPESAQGISLGMPKIRATSGLIQQPNYILNGTLFYETGPFEARLSYNRLGRALQSADQDTPERDLYEQPRSQLDFQVRYSLARSVDVYVQGANVTKAPFVVRQGPGLAYLNNYFPVGASYWLGISWKPFR